MEIEQWKSSGEEAGTKKKIPVSKMVVIAVILLIVMGIGLFFVLRGTPATGILFYEDTVEMTTGDTKTLHYTVLPDNTTNKSVKWQTSNPSVATVSATGEVTAISKGEAVIMVTTANGKVDECLITVKQTAFDYMKELGSEDNGFTVGNYSASSGAVISVGFAYNKTDDSLCIMNVYNKSGLLSTASIIIPNSLSGDYAGYFEHDYGANISFGTRVVHSTYLVNAAKFTAEKSLFSYSCDGDSFQESQDEELYAAYLRTMLIKVYQEVLEPNGYTYADLGFNLYDPS